MEQENKNLLKLINELKQDTNKLGKNFSNIDLNDIKETCWGYTNTCTNGPVSTNGFLEVCTSKGGITVLQRFTAYRTLETYERRFGEGAWTDWIKK